MKGSVVIFWWLVGIFTMMIFSMVTAPGGSEAAFYSIAIAITMGAWLDHRYDPRGALR